MKKRAPRNQTLVCSKKDKVRLARRLSPMKAGAKVEEVSNRIFNQTAEEICLNFPLKSVDLLILDPPYNLRKNYNGNWYTPKGALEYQSWFSKLLKGLVPLLKLSASIYVCSDWKTSNLVFPILAEHLIVRNRITWEREKGRGARQNWKNNTEDIWFCTLGEEYFFNVNAVKLKRQVLAPYRTEKGDPKDWESSNEGNHRLTHPSNFWSDITVPFWSMPENTDHPTQKPEKLLAKLILASTREGDFVLDPFLGSGTTAVVAKKLGRMFCGIEKDREYCYWALKRLESAEADPRIQGYEDGVFWERNSRGRK